MVKPKEARQEGKKAAAKPRREDARRRKLTLILSVETDARLDALARREGLPRSGMAERLLAEKLKGISITFRGEHAAHDDGVEDGRDG